MTLGYSSCGGWCCWSAKYGRELTMSSTHEGNGCAWNMVALATVVFWCGVLGGLLVWWLRNFG